MTILRVSDLRVRYGPVVAVDGVSFEVGEGQIIALVGANGAGKSSLLRAVMGIVTAERGTIESPVGTKVSGRPCHWVAWNCGFAYVAEDRGIFGRLTVHENLELGAYTCRKRGRGWVDQACEEMYALFPKLKERRDQVAGTLSGGEQQMLAMARALISRPRLLLLDEPSLGLAPLIVADIFGRLEAIRQAGTSILLVEQNSHMAFRVSSHAYVMERGQIVLAGKSSELANDDRVRRAYLGMVNTQ